MDMVCFLETRVQWRWEGGERLMEHRWSRARWGVNF